MCDENPIAASSERFFCIRDRLCCVSDISLLSSLSVTNIAVLQIVVSERVAFVVSPLVLLAPATMLLLFGALVSFSVLICVLVALLNHMRTPS